MIAWRPFRASLDNASARLRSYAPVQLLSARGVAAEIWREDRRDAYSTIVFQKAYEAPDVDEAERAHRRGAHVVLDLCDLHTWRKSGTAGEDERLARLARMLELAELVTVSTQELGRALGVAHAVVPDAPEEIDGGGAWSLVESVRASFERAPAVLWFGNAGTVDPPFGLVDLERAIPELNAVAARRALRLVVVTSARSRARDTVRDARFPTRVVRWSRARLPAVARRCAVAILPVGEHPFARCKSPNRLILALRLGLPVVASRIPAYEAFASCAHLGAIGAGVERVLADPVRARADVAAGRTLAEREFGTDRVAAAWIDALVRIDPSVVRP